ncbi:MAG: ornithine carbamoyltransferase [Candidatus Sericytochromatia bacterium]|uniref:Ornithine carbamoyltransferase n=1 Tax=Candidatus Tanganyikabacteria bacterium TaxID=2961651 RepID=A0A938BLR2_9BACT|nr:ornithine carbamoyltransferase [Candidatus Tanganyikabacteria bacterium]
MASNMRGKSFIAETDLSVEEFFQILRFAETLKLEKLAGKPHPLLAGKALAMIFQKPSTRTRISFEVGITQLGGTGLYLGAGDLQLKRGETLSDTAQTLSRYVDGIMARTYAHQDVVDLATFGTVPVINGLTDLNHPCQAMADYFTIYEKKGYLGGRKLAYVGDGNNMCHSLLGGGALAGMHVVAACPKGYQPGVEYVERARELARFTGARVEVTSEPAEAVKDADVVYTDVWASMGQEEEHQKRVKAFKGYQIDSKLTRGAKKDFIFMHCLPAHRGEEVAADVIDGPHSVVWDQAENRLHVQKAIMALLMA